MFDVLDSVMQWGGVVDELDYAQKLQQLLKITDKPLTSPVLQEPDFSNKENVFFFDKRFSFNFIFSTYCRPYYCRPSRVVE